MKINDILRRVFLCRFTSLGGPLLVLGEAAPTVMQYGMAGFALPTTPNPFPAHFHRRKCRGQHLPTKFPALVMRCPTISPTISSGEEISLPTHPTLRAEGCYSGLPESSDVLVQAIEI
jgi:hypothetical protein